MNWFAILVLGLLLLRDAVEWWLDHLNQQSVLASGGRVPAAFAGTMDQDTFAKSAAYTLAKIRLGRVELLYALLVMIAVLFSGFLPWSFYSFTKLLGQSAWALAGYLFAVTIVLALSDLPFSWYAQFRLEQKFGFNTMTLKLWIVDRLKGLLVAALLGYPLLVLILKLVEWSKNAWWLWAWGVVLAFQCTMMILAPIFILPWFNKLAPLPDGGLRERLLALGRKTGFHARNILVMDGSKRTRHSNAFFTSLGRWRKIVLFDTLIQQLTECELEAVLAHEIGHYKKGHIPKLLLFTAVSSLAGFWVLSWLSNQPWFFTAFGFKTPAIVPALLLFALLSGLATFWLSPLLNAVAHRFEYQADAYAAQAIGDAHPLITALRKLSEKNLSNLTPHPLYSAFHYSHPTLLEREAALRRLGEEKRPA